MALPLSLPHEMVRFAVVGIALLEIGTAALAIMPATRRLAAWSALVLHAGILFAFSPFVESRNVAVWPWNIALACSGFALIAPWKTAPMASLLAVPVLPRLLAISLAVMPAGYYLGIVDAYPAYHLYSAATASATVYCPAGCRPEQDLNASWYDFNVPLPPEPRLFDAMFRAPALAAMCCASWIRIHRRGGRRTPCELQSCPAGPLPIAQP